MAIDRRNLYEDNKTGFTLVLLHIILNVVYSIFTIKNMETNYEVGIFIMTTIILLLLGFLTAVKVQKYSMPFSFVAIIIGLFQFTRPFFANNTASEGLTTTLNAFLILSGIVCVLGGIVSIRNARIRRQCVKDYNKNNIHSIK